MNREKRERIAEEVSSALENFNGNPDTEKALKAIAEALNIDI